jgi:hypothetical protein
MRNARLLKFPMFNLVVPISHLLNTDLVRNLVFLYAAERIVCMKKQVTIKALNFFEKYLKTGRGGGIY